MSDLQLRDFFEFDEGDLAANRAGKLSAKQKAALEESEKGADKIFIGAGVLFITVGLIITYVIIRDVVAKSLPGIVLNSSDILTLILGSSLPLGLFGFFAYGAIKLGTSKLDNSVQNVEGKVNFVKVEKRINNPSNSSHPYRTEEQYELRVGKIAFENVDEELLNIIEEGDIYAFYYTKDTKEILSCEFVSTGR